MAEQLAAFQLLQWSTDDNGRGVALINGQRYTHEEVCRLRDELAEVAKIGTAPAVVKPGAMNALRELVEATEAHERRNRANTRAEYEAIEKRYLTAWTAARRVIAAGVAPCAPEFDRDTDGELLIDWSPNADRMLSLSLRADGRLSYAFRWDGETSHGNAQMPPGVEGRRFTKGDLPVYWGRLRWSEQDDRWVEAPPGHPESVTLYTMEQVLALLNGEPVPPAFGVPGTRPSKEWYAEKIADTQQAEDAAGGVLAAGGLEARVAGAVDKLMRCPKSCANFGQCKAAMHGDPGGCAAGVKGLGDAQQ